MGASAVLSDWMVTYTPWVVLSASHDGQDPCSTSLSQSDCVLLLMLAVSMSVFQYMDMSSALMIVLRAWLAPRYS